MSNASYDASRYRPPAPDPEPVRTGRPLEDIHADQAALHSRVLEATAAFNAHERTHEAEQREQLQGFALLAGRAVLLAEACARRIDSGMVVAHGAPISGQVTALAKEFGVLNAAAERARAARVAALKAYGAKAEAFEAERKALQAEADAP